MAHSIDNQVIGLTTQKQGRRPWSCEERLSRMAWQGNFKFYLWDMK